tara:strand:- start:327 stop:1046 length:720 start_codon:yes stop_codon:yes gene_type:complete
MSKYKFLKNKIILNKKIKIYSKKNSKKLYCKLKIGTKTVRYKNKMVSIKDYKKYYNKKMKGGVKSQKSQMKKKSMDSSSVRDRIREKFGTKTVVFKPKKLYLPSKVPQKSAFNNRGYKMHIEDTASGVKWGKIHERRYEPDPLRKHSVHLPGFSSKSQYSYSAGFFAPRRKIHNRIPHRGPTVQQKRNREVARQRAFDHELKRAREERIHLNLGIRNKPNRLPYNIEKERRNRIKNMGY